MKKITKNPLKANTVMSARGGGKRQRKSAKIESPIAPINSIQDKGSEVNLDLRKLMCSVARGCALDFSKHAALNLASSLIENSGWLRLAVAIILIWGGFPIVTKR